MKWAMMVLRMSGMSWTPFFTSNRRSKSSLNSRPIALTLSAHAIETNDGSCLTLIHRQTILNHLAIVIASRDQLFVACIAEVFLFGSQGRQVISAPNDTGDVVRTVALGTHAATHQLLDQEIARKMKLQHKIDRERVFDRFRLNQRTRKTIQNHTRLVLRLLDDLLDHRENDFVRNKLATIHVRLYYCSKRKSSYFNLLPKRRFLSDFLLHIISRPKCWDLRNQIQE